MKIDISQIISQIVGFLLLYWILKKFAWKPFARILDERKEKIRGEFERIQKKNGEVQKLFEEYYLKEKQFDLKIKLKMEEAVQQGKDMAIEIEKDAKKRATKILKQAEAEAQKEIAKQSAKIKEEIISTASLMAERISGEKTDISRQGHFIQDVVDKAEFDE